MQTQTLSDKKVIACNYATDVSECAKGALCYIIDPGSGMGSERIWLFVRSRGGRWISKWEASWRLNNFRVKTIPPQNPLYKEEKINPRIAERDGAEMYGVIADKERAKRGITE